MPMSENDQDTHIIEAVGRSKIVIKDGKVTEVSGSRIRHCPLAKKFALPVDDITPDAVRANIEHRMESWGMCRSHRSVCGRAEFVGFGASELIGSGLSSKSLDAAVLACDGAGTVIATSPELVQGIGGRMSGLVSTSPLKDEMDRIEQNGGFILDRTTAKVDQVLGVSRASAQGFRTIAVTVASADDAVSIRKDHPDAFIFGVHLSGISEEDAARIISVSDIVTACASKWIWELAGPRALVQAGTAVPVFALTPQGKRLILEKIERTDRPVLITGSKLPSYGPEVPQPLI
ncbi:MAG: methanogenesis marker 8 protein [Methanoregula sp.]|uniref:methanogenesis marker 8 protein n=1 Tax=Methanoregula sp. TaxID=2052170 RepID=UPI003D0DFFFD